MPAGFTDDGVPIGVELMGAAWTEPQLLSLAYSYEQATHPRRPPSTTPGLVGGKPPAPVAITGSLASTGGPSPARYWFRYDPVNGTVAYELMLPAGTTMTAAVLRRGPKGPIVAVLLTPTDHASSGQASLGAAAQAALRTGDVIVEVTTNGGGVLTAPVRVAK
jgi:hypothetical protein